MMLAKARIINYNRNCSFIVLATVIIIVNYDCHLFIVQATDCYVVHLHAAMLNVTTLHAIIVENIYRM
jgi:hypothetical protein